MRTRPDADCLRAAARRDGEAFDRALSGPYSSGSLPTPWGPEVFTTWSSRFGRRRAATLTFSPVTAPFGIFDRRHRVGLDLRPSATSRLTAFLIFAVVTALFFQLLLADGVLAELVCGKAVAPPRTRKTAIEDITFAYVSRLLICFTGISFEVGNKLRPPPASWECDSLDSSRLARSLSSCQPMLVATRGPACPAPFARTFNVAQLGSGSQLGVPPIVVRRSSEGTVLGRKTAVTTAPTGWARKCSLDRVAGSSSCVQEVEFFLPFEIVVTSRRRRRQEASSMDQ